MKVTRIELNYEATVSFNFNSRKIGAVVSVELAEGDDAKKLYASAYQTLMTDIEMKASEQLLKLEALASQRR